MLALGAGAGATLDLLARRGLDPLGIDYSPTLTAEAVAYAPAILGDIERLPVADATLDGALAECVLSAVPDKRAALAELHRALRPGGQLGITDVTLEGTLGEPLDSLVGWIACAAGAPSAAGARALIADAGFGVETLADYRDELRALVEQARRRLGLLQGALGTGIVPTAIASGLTADLARVIPEINGLEAPVLVEAGQHAIALTLDAIDDGRLSYAALTARRR